jgi:hypothetical protein
VRLASVPRLDPVADWTAIRPGIDVLLVRGLHVEIAGIAGGGAREEGRLNRMDHHHITLEAPHAPPAPAKTEPGERAAAERAVRQGRHRTIGLWLLALVSTAAWYRLYRWYGLFENEQNTHFAFEKIPGWFDSPIIRQTLLLFLLIAACYGATILMYRSLHSPGWAAKSALVALIAGPAVFNVILYPVGALDVFNYMIELKLTYFYDQNPYLVTFEAYRGDSYALPAFLVNITLFYGPAWLVGSWLPAAIAGFDDVLTTLLALKIFNFGLLALTGLLIARYQRDPRARWLAATIFLANPLVLFEGVANAHNDVLMTVFLIGAMLALQRRSPLAGPLLALSALVKFNTLVLAPLFVVVAIKDRWGWARAAQTIVLTALAVTLVSAPWWGEGKLVDGLRDGLEQSQVMDHVSLFSLAQQYAQQREADASTNPRNAEFIRSRPSAEVLPDATRDRLRYGFGAAMAIGAIILALAAWKGYPPELAAAGTMLLLALLGTNLYGWYLIPIFALLAMRFDRTSFAYIVAATALGLVYYPMYVYAHFTTEWSRFHVHLFLALFLTLPILLYLLTSWTLALRRRRPAGQT